MSDPAETLRQALASACHAADTCVLDRACPFVSTCRIAEQAEDDPA